MAKTAKTTKNQSQTKPPKEFQQKQFATKGSLKIFRAELMHCLSSIKIRAAERSRLKHYKDCGLVVDETGVVVDLEDFKSIRTKYPKATLVEWKNSIIIPGFVDAHLHMPQLNMIGAYGENLLGWLKKYTFPTEADLGKNRDLSQAIAQQLMIELLRNGTTTAAIYTTVHGHTCDQTFMAAEQAGIRAIIGKVSMDRNAPRALTMSAKRDLELNEELIEKWHGKNSKLHYAITPRFAPTSTPLQLKMLGDLFQKTPGLYMQTHLSESRAELEWVKKLYPKHRDYLSVYADNGLIGEKAIFGHAIHLRQNEINRIEATHSAICHCPSSNLFLGSGLCPITKYLEQGLNVALGSDIGAGTSLSLWRNLLDAYKIQQLAGASISPSNLLYLATLGGAEALKMEQRIGNLVPGKQADFQVLRWDREELLARRMETEENAQQRLFALITHADKHLVAATAIDGQLVFENGDLNT
ncbi:MAG: guanine deaminase [Oligoflexales bacterium]|nr:guanine deaminase [Oligoflexales bacterium]